MNEPEITQIQKLSLQEDDVLVMRCGPDMQMNAVAELAAEVGKMLPHNKILVMDDRIELLILSQMVEGLPSECPTPGCGGDTRYSSPGRGHITGCTYPMNLEPN